MRAAARPKLALVPERVLYYIQTKGYCGNCLIFWRDGGHGYTCNLDVAWRVTRDEAERICRNRPTEDFAIPCAIIDAAAQRHVNSEAVRAFAEKFSR